jgi:hypothetical protein
VEREAVKRDGRAVAAAEVDEPQHRSVGCSRYRIRLHGGYLSRNALMRSA